MDKLESKFTWRVENFSQLEVKMLYSLTFLVNEKKWKVILFPKGIKTNDDHLSMYLDVVDSSHLPNGWSIPSTFSITLINQIDTNKTIKKELAHTFNAQESNWGFESFISLSELHDKSGGYLLEDACLIEVEVHVPVDVSPTANHKALDSSISILDNVGSVHNQAQSFLQSLSKKPLTSVASASNRRIPLLKRYYAKEILDILISSSLDDIADPSNESAIMESLSTLIDLPDLCGRGVGEAIMNLKYTFPKVVQEWRDSYQVKGGSEHPWSTFEKTKSVLEHLVKVEEGIRTKLEELDKNEKELEAQVEAVESKSRKLKEEREELSNQTNIIFYLVKELDREVEAKVVEVDRDNHTVEEILKAKWATTRQLFA